MISSAPQPGVPRRIGLILEGTYPFVSGGVSTWVHQMIEAMPDFEFSIHYIGDQKSNTIEYKYELPPNVTAVTTSYLFDSHDPVQSKPGRGSRRQKQEFLNLIRSIMSATGTTARFDALCKAAVILRDQPGMFTLHDLLKSKASWQLLTEFYQTRAAHTPFLRYHATIRDLATTFWKLLHTATTLPTADVYHCVCTGYAGLLGALASRLHDVPLFVSEHGVYLKERIEDIRKSTWLAPHPALTTPFEGELGTFKNLWISFFDLLCRIAYNQASCVTALFQGNARVQMEFGAPPERVAIIPNGIDTTRFADIAREKLQQHPPADGRVTVGFLGRVVPIKDVKTLLRAARLVLKTHPETRFLLAGPTDEDPEYFEECLALAAQLGISQSVEFPGRMKPDEFLRRSDIVILTSISEGLPFAVLEASAAGLPVVSTDVGACREMIADQLPSHPTLGPSGIVTEVANPASTATALNQLVGNADLRFEQGMNGLRRVQSAYRQEDIVDRYHQLYQALAARSNQRIPAAH